MLKTESRVISGSTYVVTQIPAMQALRLFSRLAGALAGPLARLADVVKGGVGDMDLGAVGGVVALACEKLPPDELELVTRELLYSFTRDGKPLGLASALGRGSFDIDLAGDVLTILELLKFAFEVNYGNFFVAVSALIKKSETAKIAA